MLLGSFLCPLGSQRAALASLFGFHFCIASKNQLFDTFGALGVTQESFLGFWDEKYDQKSIQRENGAPSLFDVLFTHTSTFYVCQTQKKRQKIGVPNKKKYEQFIHTCTFYVSKTHKCAVTVFYNFNESTQRKNIKDQRLQVFILEQCLLNLAPL